MKKTILAGGLAAASMAALVAGAALAQQAPAPAASAAPAARHVRMEARQAQPVTQAQFVQARVSRLTALDVNHDGTVTAEELRAGAQARRVEQATRRFDRLDADKNGQISRAEFDAAHPEHGARGPHAGMRGEHRGSRMAHRHGGAGQGRGHGPAERVARHGPIVIADVQTKLTEGFTRLDADHDGVLSPAERQAGRAVMRERFQERRAQRQNRAPAATSASPSAPASE